MKGLIRLYFLFTVFFSILSCSSPYHITNHNVTQYRIKPDSPQDSSLSNLLKPYYIKMASAMERVIAVSDVEFIKKQPSCNMGNLFSDILMFIAETQFKTPVDLAILNHGGMRLTSMAPGNITLGKVYELSPFDNMVVIVKINGKVLQQLLNLSANKGGWPIAGATYFIKDKKAVDVQVGAKPLDENKTYSIVTIDYLANGGDDADMLRGIAQLNNNIILRDAVVIYFEKLSAEGKHIVDLPEKRVQYAE